MYSSSFSFLFSYLSGKRHPTFILWKCFVVISYVALCLNFFVIDNQYCMTTELIHIKNIFFIRKKNLKIWHCVFVCSFTNIGHTKSGHLLLLFMNCIRFVLQVRTNLKVGFKLLYILSHTIILQSKFMRYWSLYTSSWYWKFEYMLFLL